MTTADALTPDVARSEMTESTARRKGSAPGWVIWLLIVLASVIAISSGLNTWVKRQLLDTDNWVETSEELLANDDIRQALSVYLVDELYTNVDVADELESRLPDSLQGLAGPITAGLRGPASEAVDRLLATDGAQAAWVKANTVAHQTLVNILKDETRDGVSTAGGVVTLELGTLVADVGTQIGLPSSLLDRIPPGAGTIVVADSEELESAQQAVRIIEIMSVVLFFVVLAMYIAAVYFANDRRKALRNVGLALVVSGAILLFARQIGVVTLVDEVQGSNQLESAVRAAALIGTDIVSAIAWSGIAIGVLLAIYGVLVGPSRAATTVRRGLAPLFNNRLTALLTAAVIVIGVGWLTPGTGVQAWYARLILLVLVVVGVERLRALTRREHPDASWGGVWRDVTDWDERETSAVNAAKSNAVSAPAIESVPATAALADIDA